MAAFTPKDPGDLKAFLEHWMRISNDPAIHIRTIVCDEQVVGSVLSYEEEGRQEVSYWLGREYWGKGLATRALTEFLTSVNTTRPIYARVAKDNFGSRRVLDKCSFRVIGESSGFANARHAEITELLLERTN